MTQTEQIPAEAVIENPERHPEIDPGTVRVLRCRLGVGAMSGEPELHVRAPLHPLVRSGSAQLASIPSRAGFGPGQGSSEGDRGGDDVLVDAPCVLGGLHVEGDEHGLGVEADRVPVA